LDRVYQGLYAPAARQRPDEFASAALLTLNGTGASVVLAADLIEIRRLQTALGAKVHLIPGTEIDRTWHIAPSVYRTGNTLQSRGRAGDPVLNDVLTAWLLASGTPMSSLGATIDSVFPTRHHEILVNDLALYMDAKDEDRDPAQYQKLVRDQAMKLAQFAQEFDL